MAVTVSFSAFICRTRLPGTIHTSTHQTPSFCRAALNAGRSSHEKAVCLSVCLSVKRVHCDKTEERSVLIFIPYERWLRLVSSEEEWLVEATSTTWHFGSTGPLWSEIPDFQSIFARSASAVASGKKVQLSLIGSPLTRFPVSLRWTSYIAPNPPKGARKRETAVFQVKSHFAWRKSATNFLCVKTVSDKVVRHSLAYLFVRKWLVRDVPFYVKTSRILTDPLAKRWFSIYFRL